MKRKVVEPIGYMTWEDYANTMSEAQFPGRGFSEEPVRISGIRIGDYQYPIFGLQSLKDVVGDDTDVELSSDKGL